MKTIKKGTKRNRLQKLTTGAFYHYAEEFRKAITSEEELEKLDFTEIFWNELKAMILNGELINMNINAPPTFGKSTTAMAIAQEIMRWAWKKEFGTNDIDRDQQEFSKVMRDPKLKATIRVIDEWNDLEATGENSSVETALFNYFSDVMAQRFIHKISCSPKDAPDKNAQIFLEIISNDKKKQINYCKLYFRIYNQGAEYNQLLGIVKISVKQVLNKEWYIEYRRKKFEKMDLILKEGIFRPRTLEYAEVIYEVVERLGKLTKFRGIINQDIIKNYIKIECRKRKVIQSIIGEELATKQVKGILDMYKSYWKISKDIKIRTSSQNKELNKTGEVDEDIEFSIKELEETRKEMLNAIILQKNELIKYRKINEEYNKRKE